MVLLQKAIMEMQIKRLIKKKVECTLCRMEEELKKELEDKDSDSIEINFGKDKELCRYVIQIEDKQIHFTLEDITKAILESNQFNKDTNEYNAPSTMKYSLVKNI